MKRLDSKNLPMTAAAVSMIAAPAFLVASALVSPQLKSDEAAQIGVIAEHPTRWYWFTLLLLIGSILLVPALLGIATLVHERSPRLANIGGGLAILGSLIAIGDVMTQFVSWQMVAHGADRAQMAALLHPDRAGLGGDRSERRDPAQHRRLHLGKRGWSRSQLGGPARCAAYIGRLVLVREPVAA